MLDVGLHYHFARAVKCQLIIACRNIRGSNQIDVSSHRAAQRLCDRVPAPIRLLKLEIACQPYGAWHGQAVPREPLDLLELGASTAGIYRSALRLILFEHIWR